MTEQLGLHVTLYRQDEVLGTEYYANLEDVWDALQRLETHAQVKYPDENPTAGVPAVLLDRVGTDDFEVETEGLKTGWDAVPLLRDMVVKRHPAERPTMRQGDVIEMGLYRIMCSFTAEPYVRDIKD